MKHGEIVLCPVMTIRGQTITIKTTGVACDDTMTSRGDGMHTFYAPSAFMVLSLVSVHITHLSLHLFLATLVSM